MARLDGFDRTKAALSPDLLRRMEQGMVDFERRFEMRQKIEQGMARFEQRFAQWEARQAQAERERQPAQELEWQRERMHGHHPRAPFQERGAGQNSPDNKESVMSEQAITDELFGMMKVAQAQQETVETCLRALTAERIALAKERAALAQQTEAVRQAASAALVVIRKA